MCLEIIILMFEKKFFLNLDKNFLFENQPKIAVAVSGGPDSIALTFLLKKWILKKKGKLIALIVDHQIRKESFIEANIIKKYLEYNKIHCLILKVSERHVHQGKMIQARKNRLSKITNYCNRNQIFNLFIAHHYSDNIETFLLRKLAGSNFEGLNSIREKNIYNNIRIIRPLINFSKKNILTFLNKKNLFFINDPSNMNEKYSRIFIRNFIKLNNRYLKNIELDFSIIKKNYNDYRKMIFQIYNLVNLGIYKNRIIFHLIKFLNLDVELQTKLIEINYKYFYPKKPFLRYIKTSRVIERMQKENVLKLASMKIERKGNSLSFMSN